MGNKLNTRSMRKKAAKRKAAKLMAQAAMREIQKAIRAENKASKSPYSETYVRAGVRDGKLVITHRAALLGNPSALPLVLDEYEVVGLLEEPEAFSDLVARMGLTTLAALVGQGLDKDATAADLVKKLVSFTRIDVEAIRKAIAEEEAKAAEAAPVPEQAEAQAALAEPQEALL